MSVLVLVLGLIAAAGVFSTMLLDVRERSRDVAILKAVGMTPRQLLTMVMTSSAVLGLIGGLVAMPLGVRTYHWLMTQLAHQIGNRPPPFAFDVLHPTTLYPLGVMGLRDRPRRRLLPCPSGRPQPGRRGPAIGVRAVPGRMPPGRLEEHPRQLFALLGPMYDRVGAALSLGQDPLGRRFLVSRLPRGGHVLDVATGTGSSRRSPAAGIRGDRRRSEPWRCWRSHTVASAARSS